jgi:hypothetical protein
MIQIDAQQPILLYAIPEDIRLQICSRIKVQYSSE